EKDETIQEANTTIDAEKNTTYAIKLPSDIVQLNDTAHEGDGITLTKAQIQNTEENKFVYKIFLQSDNMDAYKNGEYSVFIQNFPYEGDVHLLDTKFQKAKIETYWVNLKGVKPHKDEYVIFRAFDSKIYDYQKIVLGVMNTKEKTDLIRVEFEAPSIIN